MKLNKVKKEIKATRMFTDRTEPRKAFWNKYNYMKENLENLDDVYVLNYYGVGGIGKSTLLREIQKEMEEKENKPYYIAYDFQINQDVYSLLKNIRTNLIEKYKFEFPKFDIALICYAKRMGDKADREEVKGLVEKSKTLSLILDVAEFVPQTSIASSLVKLADSGIAWVRNLGNKEYKVEVAKLETQSTDEILKRLPEYFAEDMANNVNELDKPFVFFLDTYEKLVDTIGEESKSYVKDLWIRDDDGLVLNIPNTLWVIAGREKLNWEKYNEGWADSIESHILGDLGFQDADGFLKEAGFSDENLRKQLYELTNGTPIYLDICVSTLEKLLRNDEEVKISKFGGNTDQLLERFIRYMDNQTREVTHLLCLFESWNDKIIYDVASKILPSFSAIVYDTLKDASFVINEDDKYYVHKTVKEIINKECPKMIKSNFYNVMYDYLYKYLTTNSNVIEDEYCNYLNMYLDLLSNNFKAKNAFNEIERFMHIYNTIRICGNTELAYELLDEGINFFVENVKEDDKAISMLLPENAYLAQYNDICDAAITSCTMAIADFIEHDTKDLFGMYRILEFAKDHVNFIPKDELYILGGMCAEIDLNEVLYLDKETNQIYGKSAKYYQYKVIERVLSLIDYDDDNIKKLFVEKIDSITSIDEKIEITLELLLKLNDSNPVQDYTKYVEHLKFCEDFLSNEENYKNVFGINVAYLQADIAQIYTKEMFYDIDKAKYWIDEAMKTANKYYEDNIEVYVKLVDKKYSILLTSNEEEAHEYFKGAFENIEELFGNEDAEILINNMSAKVEESGSIFSKNKNNELAKRLSYFNDFIENNGYEEAILKIYQNNIPEYYKVMQESESASIVSLFDNIGTLFSNGEINYSILAKVWKDIFYFVINNYEQKDKEMLYLMDSINAFLKSFRDVEREDLLNKYIEYEKAIYGEDSLNILYGYELIADFYYTINAYDKYIEVCKKIQKIYSDIVPDEYTNYLIEMEIARVTAINNKEAAIEIYEKLKQENTEEVLGNTLYNSANLKMSMDSSELLLQGIQELEEVYDMIKDKYPEGNKRIKDILVNIENGYVRLGKNTSDNVDDKAKYWFKALDLAISHNNEMIENILPDIEKLSIALLQKGDCERANNMLKRIYDTTRNYNSFDKNINVLTVWSLSNSYLKKFQDSVDVCLEFLNTLDEEQLNVLENKYKIYSLLANSYSYNSDYEKAIYYFEICYEMCLEIYREDVGEIQKSARRLANTYWFNAQYDKFLDINCKLYDGYKDQMNQKEKTTTRMDIASGYAYVGKDKEAEEIADEVLNEIRYIYGDKNNTSYINCLNIALITYIKIQKIAKAKDVSQELRPLVEKNYNKASERYDKMITRCDEADNM